jgi:adenylate cyclase
MLGELVPCGGGESVPLHGENLTVGRRPDNDVCLPLKFVSGKHCRLEFKSGKWHVYDLGSRNGVKIDGKRCESGIVEPNSILGLGRAEYKLVYAGDAAGSKHPVLPVDDASNESSDSDSFWSELMMLEGVPAPAPPPIGSLSSQIATNDLGMLVPCGGGDPIKLFRKSLLVGRRSRCDITLDFGTISGKHCRLEFRDDFWHIEDLGSRNGVKIEGERVDAGWLLPGTIVAIAKQRFEIRYETPDGAKPPVHDPFEKGLLEKAGLKQAPVARPEDEDEPPRPRFEIT